MAQHYQKLGESCFRLLSFHNDRGMSCRLEPHYMTKAPSYIALSYTWALASNQRERSSSLAYFINMNDEIFHVQQNLYDALGHLAKRVRDRQCLLWVDAICINQGDAEERNAQVRQMKDIYQNADYIFAWLGLPHDEEETRLAIKMMGDLNLYLKNGLEENGGYIGPVMATISTSHTAFPTDKTSETWKAWEGIAELFNESYWQRTWIYQEATTPGEIWFFYGDHKFDDIYLSAAVAFGLAFSYFPGFDLGFLQAVGQASDVAVLNSARIQREKGLERGLIDLMIEMRLTRCTDEKDKVFAPLGHTADSAARYIIVDYTKSLEEVYIDVVRFAISNPKTSRLDFLGLVFTPADDASNESLKRKIDPTLPSWVPDWRQTVIIPSFDKSSEETEDNVPLYNPCPGTAPEVYIIGQALQLKGAVVESLSVATLTTVWDDAEASLEGPRDWYRNLMATEAEAGSAHLDVCIRRSLVADRAQTEVPNEDNGFVSKWKRGGMVDFNLIDAKSEEQSSYDKQVFMIGNISAVCYGRRMARLRGGSIAVLPAAAKIGDKIALFFGGRCLYVIRPTNNPETYNFVGECYVDGCMDGALTDELNSKSIFLKLV